MTSNIGSEYILENNKEGEEKALEALKRTFRPEFINRIDELIIFNSLNKEVIYKILDKIINELETRLKQFDLKIELTNEAKEYIINESFEESFGARPIKRYVTHNIETLLADKIIKDEVKYGSRIIVDIKDNKLILNL